MCWYKSVIKWSSFCRSNLPKRLEGYKSGFGGKFGLQTDRVDNSAVGWEYFQPNQKHASQTGKIPELGLKSKFLFWHPLTLFRAFKYLKLSCFCMRLELSKNLHNFLWFNIIQSSSQFSHHLRTFNQFKVLKE